MISISQRQAFDRWDSLPEKLREALYSEINSDFLWKAAEAEHIPKEKIYTIAKIAGYVILGFLHPGDFGGEVKEALQLNPQVAEALARAMDERVFKPINDDLNKIYNPPSKFDSTVAPRMMDEIKKPSIPKPPGPPSPPPAFSSNLNLMPKPIGGVGAGLTGKSATPVPPSTGPASMAEPAPQILQEEAEFKPLRQQSGFGIGISMPKSIDSGAGKEKIPMRPAMLEFSSTAAPQAPKSSEEKNPRVVHYSELRTQLSPASTEQNKSTPPSPSSAANKPLQNPDSHTREEITAMPSSAPIPPASFGSMARPTPAPVSMPAAPAPAPFPPKNIPAAPSVREIPVQQWDGKEMPHPKMNDVFLSEKELPPPAPRPAINPGRIPPTPPAIPPRPPRI